MKHDDSKIPPIPPRTEKRTERIEARITSTDQIPEVIQKLKDYEQELNGRTVKLKKFEEELQAKEFQLKLYRKQILIAIKEQLMQHPKYEEQVKILEKFRDILEFVVKDIKEDIDEIMG
jgi:septal ring factor EnvC (AmiA/AmiB activator)